jgi:hypothetical protein
MNGITIRIKDSASPVLNVLAKYSPEERQFVNGFIGKHVQVEVRDYLRDHVATRHASAEKLGAEPTNFWGPAVRSVESPEALSTTPGDATITIFGPGIGRADHDVDIYPTGGKQWLTIPANAAAYGNRFLVGTAERAHFDSAGNLLPPRVAGAPLYIFAKEAHLRQDRTLLPSDADIMAAAIEGAAEGIDAIIQKASGEQQTVTV